MFRTLQNAIAQVAENQIVVAEDISAKQQKRFRVDTVGNLDKQYRALNQPHWYECLLVDRPSRLFLDVENDAYVDIAAIAAFVTDCIRERFGTEAHMEILDSCSDQKYSWHIIVTNLYFKNVYHVGAFVRRIVLAMEHGQGCELATAVDTAVYTKNRMFRVCGSTKFGSQRVLKHAKPWFELLVQNPTATFVECCEIDGSAPMSTSARPSAIFHHRGDKWVQVVPRRELTGSETTQCPLINPVLDWLDTVHQAKTQRHTLKMRIDGSFTIYTRSKQCGIANRTHKSNNIWYRINPVQNIIVQKCHDEDCGRKTNTIPHPSQLWSRWNSAWLGICPLPICQKTLYNESY